MRTIWFFIRPYLGLIVRGHGARLIRAAADAVSEAEYAQSDDQDRRDCARFQTDTVMRRAGINLPERIIHGAIEAALDRHKRKWGG